MGKDGATAKVLASPGRCRSTVAGVADPGDRSSEFQGAGVNRRGSRTRCDPGYNQAEASFVLSDPLQMQDAMGESLPDDGALEYGDGVGPVGTSDPGRTESVIST